MATEPVVVLGAGVAGLIAARELRRAGFDVTVLEAGKQVAGLAASHTDDDGFSYDTGAHFITNRLAAALGAGSECRTVHHYGETVLLDGRTYSYPFGLLRSSRFLAAAMRSRLSKSASDNAADWFRAQYGAALADEVALPLVEAWSGAPASELSAAVGDKIPSSVLETAWLRLAARGSRRAVAIGYCRAKPQSSSVWHVYPERGVGALCEKVAEGLDGAVRLESKVERVYVQDGRTVGVRVNGEDLGASLVVSTAPVNVLPKMVEGTDRLDRFLPFRYRPMVFVNLKLRGRGLIPDVVLWTPEDRFPFFRLTEAPQSMPWLAPDGSTILTVDIGAKVGDEHWTMDEDQLSSLCLDHLAPIIPDVKRRFLGARVVRTPIAYPVFLRSYEADRVSLQAGTGVEGLMSIGRNGEFDHLLMEDIYWRTTQRIQRWAGTTAARSVAA